MLMYAALIMHESADRILELDKMLHALEIFFSDTHTSTKLRITSAKIKPN